MKGSAMAKKRSSKRKALQNVPQNREDLSRAVARVGSLQRRINEAASRAEEKIAEIKETLTEEIAESAHELETTVLGIQAYAESNRKELTDGGKTKTVRLATGSVLWRMTPPRTVLKKVEEVLARIEELGLTRFIRTKKEVDKEQLLKEPLVAEGIKGVTIVQNEEFVIKPDEVGVEEIVTKVSMKKSS